MAPITQNAPDEDELDAILDDIINGDYGNDANMTSAPPITSSKRKLDSGNDVLGIEEEIQIVKERRKIPKLDEERFVELTEIEFCQGAYKDQAAF
jgi:replication fork protection complex subunit Csm3/Swi3